ncbi:hypothetical protein EC991_001792 [Linnemannia zychae]|nr:hypothetical protein EC991_001792 [Linnemannia zychae]
MVAKLFNDLVTALDILPESSTVDLCVNHPSPCVLAGKVRVIVKRPCVYKSLVLTVTGTSRVSMRQGAKTIKAKQIFLNVSKEVVFENGGGLLTTGHSQGAIGAREQQQRRQQQRASSLSSTSSLSNSHPSNNIPVSEESSPSTSAPAITTGAAATASTVLPMAASTTMNRMTATAIIPQGASTTISAQPAISGEPSHRLSIADSIDSSPMTHPEGTRNGLSTPPADNSQSAFIVNQENTFNHSTSTYNNNNNNNNSNSNGAGTNSNGLLQNQLRQGVNDIDFHLEFPSHVDSTPNNNNNASGDSSRSLPSGPFKSFSGDSSIVYTIRATLVMSRRDILVNNQITTSIPFRVQCWQDMIDWRNHSEDHSYHGKRRGKIEFRLQVPKQLDTRRLHDLQFGFEAKWKTLNNRLKIREVQYSIIEEETQM